MSQHIRNADLIEPAGPTTALRGMQLTLWMHMSSMPRREGVLRLPNGRMRSLWP